MPAHVSARQYRRLRAAFSADMRTRIGGTLRRIYTRRTSRVERLRGDVTPRIAAVL